MKLPTGRRRQIIVLGVLAAISIVFLITQFDTPTIQRYFASDWNAVPALTSDWDLYRAATLAFFRGENPYDEEHVFQFHIFNPPWVFPLLLPLAVLPRYVGLVLLSIISCVSLLAISKHYEMDVLESVLVIVSVMHLHSIANGNVEFLPLLGVMLPPPLALIILAIKPQSTIGMMLFVVYKVYKERGWKRAMLTVMPLAALTAAWLIFYGLPQYVRTEAYWWPWSIIVGVAALGVAFWKNDERWALLSSPFFAPHAYVHSYLGGLFVFRGWKLLAVVVFTWALVLVLGR